MHTQMKKASDDDARGCLPNGNWDLIKFGAIRPSLEGAQ